jgi:CheY-like chemotaxis protein
MVPTTKELVGDYVMLACAHCGLGLGVQPATQAEVRAITGDVPRDPALGRIQTAQRAERITGAIERGVVHDPRQDPTPAATPAPARQMRRVAVVEDSGFLRQVISDLLVERQLCREVVGFDDGPAFIEAFARGLKQNDRPDLIVLDVRMPVMDGRSVAQIVRTLEATFEAKRVPILFFSAVRCDAEFKAMLKALGSARYIRKVDGDVESLGERVAAVLAKLIGA